MNCVYTLQALLVLASDGRASIKDFESTLRKTDQLLAVAEKKRSTIPCATAA